MLEKALRYLSEVRKPELIELEQRPYTTEKVYPLQAPVPSCLQIHTLTGVVDYLRDNPDGLELDTLLIRVYSATVAGVFSRLMGPFEQRAEFLAAKHDQPVFQFDKYYDIESFIIALQSQFVPDETVALILQLVGNITDDQIAIYADDGTTQQVTAKNGVGMVQKVAVPNPVLLRPFRTFGEIEQPEGRFVLRMKSGNGTGSGRPAVALFQADGGVWGLAAICSIRDWLRERVPDEVTIIA